MTPKWEKIGEFLLSFTCVVIWMALVTDAYFSYLRDHHHTNLFAWSLVFWFVLTSTALVIVKMIDWSKE